MYNLGGMYAQGQGVSQHYAKARQWFEKAAAASNAEAMFMLGALYEHGAGVPQDYLKAREWYEKARDLCRNPAVPAGISLCRRGVPQE
jgi:TPR repeat protein